MKILVIVANMKVWAGYFIYDDEYHEMTFDSFEIDENTGKVCARGSDYCGEFNFEGNIDGSQFEAIKNYPSWVILYSGRYDPEKLEIVGSWGYNPGEPLSPFTLIKIPCENLALFRSRIAEQKDPLSI